MKKKNIRARRRFLSMLGLGVAGLSFTSPEKDKKDLEKGETQFMLTADGQLVEVPKKVLNKAKRRSVRSNKSLWSWLQGHKER